MKQYKRIKSEYPDTILLFRMGDFFETFEEDALTASRVLGITLTKRGSGAAGDVPLAGFPHHALDTYLPKLVKAGMRVAVCEQIEDPKLAKGIVKRDVVEVVTPGIVFTDRLLDHKHYNFLCAVVFRDDVAGVSFIDASTGDFFTTETPVRGLVDQIGTIGANEIIIAKKDYDRFKELVSRHYLGPVTRLDDWLFRRDAAYELLLTHFKTQSLKGFGVEGLDAGLIAAGAIVFYIKETQKAHLGHIRNLRYYSTDEYITLDASTRRNLEIVSSIGDSGRDGSLVSVLDRTRTSMGGRLFSYWITHPLKKLEPIQKRLDSVRSLTVSHDEREVLKAVFAELVDFDRLAGRLCTGRATPRDLIALKQSMRRLPAIRQQLENMDAPLLTAIRNSIVPLDDLAESIEATLVDEPPAALMEGGVIRPGYHAELDEIRDIATNARDWMTKYQERMRQETGIASLRLEYNRAFGYYLSVSKSNLDKVPEHFIRRQTLVNAERYITPELQEYEDKILHARDQIAQLESELFNELRLKLADASGRIQQVSRAIAELDCLVSLASVALEYRYVCPDINEGTSLTIVEGRHPVVERLLPPGDRFVANDLDVTEDRHILVITGPNMSGKSTYLRQVGLIVLLAQIGSFVPAESASVGIVDRIFTRVGASDNIAAGESTFLVEMQEAAYILNNATPRSLVLLDEIGRGTSTFDGISIAWAMTEYLHEVEHCRAKTLFATHYHELNEMADIFPRIRNVKVEVREYKDRVIFLRKVSDGTADHSYGIQVAQMAGVPEPVIERAKDILHSLEGQDLSVLGGGRTQLGTAGPGGFQINLFEATDIELKERLKEMDVNSLSPVQAWQVLEELKKLAEGR
jgi:DNA mismatch repair protein MutS